MTGRFMVTINLGNDAMREPEHIAEMLDRVAQAVRGGMTEGPLRDLNGNRVGFYSIEH